MAVGGTIIAAILTGIFAYLIYRPASAMLKNKLGEHAGDYGADPHTAALANTIKSNDALATLRGDRGSVLNAPAARKRELRAGAGLTTVHTAGKLGNATFHSAEITKGEA